MSVLDPLLSDPAARVLAYLDPGSGAILLQMLLAGIAGIGLFLKYQGRRLLGLFGSKRDDAGKDTAEKN